jgi:hypothetical protein
VEVREKEKGIYEADFMNKYCIPFTTTAGD